MLQQAGRGGESHVGCNGSNYDQINVLDAEAGIGNGPTRGLHGQVTGAFGITGNAPLLNSGPRRNPFIARFHPLAQLQVVQLSGRRIRPYAPEKT